MGPGVHAAAATAAYVLKRVFESMHARCLISLDTSDVKAVGLLTDIQTRICSKLAEHLCPRPALCPGREAQQQQQRHDVSSSAPLVDGCAPPVQLQLSCVRAAWLLDSR
jgi:predicted amino acid dehydrogenase